MKISIQDVRRAIAYGHDCNLSALSDNELLAADFCHDLNMGNIRVTNVWIELQRMYNISLPVEMFQKMKDNTVGSFLNVANEYLES